MTQKWTPSIRSQLNDLPGFPARPNTVPPADDRWELGEWIDETRVRPGVATFAALPVTGNELGDVRVVDFDQSWYYWNGLAWVPMGTGGGGPILTVMGIAPINVTAGPNPIVSHDASGAVAGTYGNATSVSQVTVDVKGHVTSATTTPITFPAAPLQSITGTAPINVTAGANPVVSHNASGAVAGTYGDASNSAQVTVDVKGHVTAATTVPISITAPIGTLVLSTGPLQVISANTDQITPVAALHRIVTNGVNHILSSTPTINLPGAVVGQLLVIQNVDTARTVTLQAGVVQQLQLSNASKQIAPGGSMILVFSVGSRWVELTHITSTTT
jgi:hypothetical protein